METREPMLSLPVTIATVPYIPTYGKRTQFGTSREPQPSPTLNSVDGLEDLPPPPPNVLGHPDIHPPSYSGVGGCRGVYIGKDKDFNTYGELRYVPVYTFSKLYEGSYDWKADLHAQQIGSTVDKEMGSTLDKEMGSTVDKEIEPAAVDGSATSVKLGSIISVKPISDN